MKTLVVDRSTEVQSVALVEDEKVSAACVLEGLDGRSGEWVVKVRDFMRANGAEKPERIVVGTGPGSFAGIRAALAFAQGFSLGADCEVLGLPSACAFAKVGTQEPLAVVGDARRGQYWVALFEGANLVTPIFETDIETLPKRVPLGVDVVSPDDKRIGALLKEKFEDVYKGAVTPLAENLAHAFLANPKLLVKEPLPIYLNPAVRTDAPKKEAQ